MANLAFADLHGNLSIWRKIQERINTNDHVYVLGDAADRGPDGYQIIKEMMNDSRITYLKGNHDDMFVRGVLEGNTKTLAHWINNCGGRDTYERWRFDGCDYGMLKWLRSRPLREFLVTSKGLILLSHAGYTPSREPLTSLTDFDFLWDRCHLYDPWQLGDEDIYVVHGHTPIVLSPWYVSWPESPMFYCDGHKVNIDMCTFETNVCTLLNLDDFSYEMIKG